MYAPQGPPAVFSSALASSVIVIAAVSRLLPPRIVSPLGLCLHIPELLSDALFFRRFLLGLHFAIDLPLPCGQITVVLLHKSRGGVIRPFEGLHIGITIFFEDTGQSVHPAVNLPLYTCNLFLQDLTLFTLEQPGRFGKRRCFFLSQKVFHCFEHPQQNRIL